MDDFTASQKQFMTELFSKLNKTINEKTTEIKEEVKNQIKEVKEDISSVVIQLQNKIDRLEKENKLLQKDKLFLERKVRKNNIVVFGVDKNESSVLSTVTTLFNDLLGVSVINNDINDIYRLNTKFENNKQPAVVVEFLSYQKKLTVLKNAKKLKGKNIYIANDQCTADRENTKILVKHQKLARSKGKTAFIRGDKLIIENDIYNIDQLLTEYIEEEVQTADKSDSAPSTPNPTGRKRQILQELGLEEEKQLELKKDKPIHHTSINTEETTKILTRSNAALKKVI